MSISKTIFFLSFLLFPLSSVFSQTHSTDETTDLAQITATLTDYIEGTANGQPERLRRAFHPDFNLYTVTDEDSLWVRDGEKYISNVKPGKKSNRVGRIISIDHENFAATAKVEILIPGWRIFTDYFLLMKYEGSWKIVQKSYTWRPIPLSPEDK
ncbi:MAG: nuclear transport factor 2 family protein [Bacteroidota bacterium]